MTKEELEKEARDYADNQIGCGDGYYEWTDIENAYLAGAEPREKQIAELEQKLEQTEKDLTDYQFNYPKIKDLEKENAELKAQLQKKINTTTVSDYPYSALKLEEAKEIIKFLINPQLLDKPQYYEWRLKAEQFLKDCDIDNAIQQANKELDFDKITDEMEQDLKDSEVEK